MKISDIHLLKKKVVIYFQQQKLEISPNTYTEFNLYLNKDISDDLLNKIKAYDTYSKDLAYAINLIDKYAYSKKKLVRKLENKKINENNINKIINYLSEHKLIDDYAFAKEYASSMLMRHKGPIAIKHKLKELGISDVDIAKVINELDQNELKNGLTSYIKSLDRRYSRSYASNKREKIVLATLRAGYERNYVIKVLSGLNLSKCDYDTKLKQDFEKLKCRYDHPNDLIKALKRKGYSYSKIKLMMEENYDLY